MFGKKKNKKGWIKIMEAFIAILFLIGILTAIVVREDFKSEDIYGKVLEFEGEILEQIQLNESLRSEVLDSSVPIDSTEAGFSTSLNTTLRNRIPTNLKCELIICEGVSECSFEDIPASKEIYVDSIIISANLEKYSPKKLNMFCWIK